MTAGLGTDCCDDPHTPHRVLRTGGPGAGHATKAPNNLVAAASLAATSEALIVGAR